MPEVTVACPHCQQSIRVMSEHAGAQVACPLCQNAMVVPTFETQPSPEQLAQQAAAEQAAREQAAAAAAQQQAAAAAAATAAQQNNLHTFACSHCTQPFQVPAASLGQAVGCPSCGNAVQLPGSTAAETPAAPQAPQPIAPEPQPQPQLTVPSAAAPTSEAPTETPPAAFPDVTGKRSPTGQRKKRTKRKANPANAPVIVSTDSGVTKPSTATPGASRPVPVSESSRTQTSVSHRPGELTNLDAARLLPPRFEPLLPRMSDMALSIDGQAVASMSFQEPVKTIMVNGQERVLRRLSPEEKTIRRRQQSIFLFVVSLLTLLVAGALLHYWRS